MEMVSVMDAAMLTDEVVTEMFEAAQRELNLDELEKCMLDALKDVKKEACLFHKLVAIAARTFLFGYYTALQDFQGIQPMLMDAAARGELEDNIHDSDTIQRYDGERTRSGGDIQGGN